MTVALREYDSIWYQWSSFERNLTISIKSLKTVHYLWPSNSDSGNLSQRNHTKYVKIFMWKYIHCYAIQNTIKIKKGEKPKC